METKEQTEFEKINKMHSDGKISDKEFKMLMENDSVDGQLNKRGNK